MTSSRLLATGPVPPEAVLDHLVPGTHVIVPLANGEPRTVLSAMDAHSGELERVSVHQMHALYDHAYLHGNAAGRLDHISYFLSPVTRRAFHAGTIDLVPCHFSEVPLLLRQLNGPKLVLASVSPPDAHGYFTLGTNADYTASFIGQVPFFVEVNARMPRTQGRNELHVSHVVGWTETDYALIDAPPPTPNALDHRIAALVAERVPDGATIQTGIGSTPTAVLQQLSGHRDLGVHTEVISDPIVDLIESGVVTGVHKTKRPLKVVTTFALGTRRLYDFLDEHPAIELLPVDWVNDPRVIAQQPNMVSINATVEVDFLGQCASETVGGRYWSGSGGQADFARGAMYSEGGQGFVVLHSTAVEGTVSRIVPRLTAGSAVTTMKNTVDKVVTEFGVAELRGKGIRQRTRALIAIAHPDFRDSLIEEAVALGYW
ncbi:MAG: acetyl-CoA hydrolase/transferase C-terminal domain-containing protein [Microthrixaceae bacterium]|jgi:acyl-CoA hydrolase|nr:acetyl-CoA hydrolase/transferase C-terminal domain-containing protein [Microthrixaceae bacterium]HMT25265.1 acetyl-CoA hydrolase/transferase C-terminal domain-containing protein [Microthrixaceae bacterium]HMT60049.1 acetyl-CoA hydrolase/transferase C-terminal domain-containing protein [Microthrixaceae bacterium]